MLYGDRMGTQRAGTVIHTPDYPQMRCAYVDNAAQLWTAFSGTMWGTRTSRNRREGRGRAGAGGRAGRARAGGKGGDAIGSRCGSWWRTKVVGGDDGAGGKERERE